MDELTTLETDLNDLYQRAGAYVSGLPLQEGVEFLDALFETILSLARLASRVRGPE